jgi:hypothetical protein
MFLNGADLDNEYIEVIAAQVTDITYITIRGSSLQTVQLLVIHRNLSSEMWPSIYANIIVHVIQS